MSMRQWCLDPCEWLAFSAMLGARAALAATARRVRVTPVPRFVLLLESRAALLEHFLQPGSVAAAPLAAQTPESTALQAAVRC